MGWAICNKRGTHDVIPGSKFLAAPAGLHLSEGSPGDKGRLADLVVLKVITQLKIGRKVL